MTPQQREQALAVARQVAVLAADSLAPVEATMRREGWAPEMRAILWGAIGRLGLQRATEARIHAGAEAIAAAAPPPKGGRR